MDREPNDENPPWTTRMARLWLLFPLLIASILPVLMLLGAVFFAWDFLQSSFKQKDFGWIWWAAAAVVVWFALAKYSKTAQAKKVGDVLSRVVLAVLTCVLVGSFVVSCFTGAGSASFCKPSRHIDC